MRTSNLSQMIKGWFVGGFSPTIYNTQDVEVAVKRYQKGDYESSHHHKIATEITVIVQGTVRMRDNEYTNGDIIVIEPNESTDFRVLSDNATTCVVKIPGVADDKYMGDV